MLGEERLNALYEIILQKKVAKIDELAQAYDVSPMTIRRDLDKLVELYPNVKRCHGGAILSTEVEDEEEFEEKKNVRVKEKERLAKAAFGLISDRDSIYLDAGTTTLELARLIAASPFALTVVTNDIEIAHVLRKSQSTVLMVGGLLQKSTGCVVGNFAEEFIAKLRFKLAFMGGTAINENYEVLTPSIEKRTMKPLVLRNASKSYLLVDSEKFGRSSIYVIYRLLDFTGIITTDSFDSETVAEMEELGINLVRI